MVYQQDGYRVTRHVCPRNCYDTCGVLAFVRNGRLEKVSGDPRHGYTAGKLCAKGYSYVSRVYSPDRLRYPMRQLGRGSGRWEKLKWDQALDIISEKILTLKQTYGSTLPICLNKYSGNFGILHYAVEGMFNSLGPTTQAIGSPCWSAGLDAQYYDMGMNANSDPSEIEQAGLIVLWGANPAWTAIHSLPYIFRAQERGAKVVVIDPVFTETARKADYYIQIKPGEDGALAVALAKLIAERGKADQDFLVSYTQGWQEYLNYLQTVDLHAMLKQCGQDTDTVNWLADRICEGKPVYFWVGFGLQRHVNGGQSLRSINALGALTGNLGISGGGVHYAHQLTWRFNFQFLRNATNNRRISINRFADELARLKDPPVKFLWVACRNLLTQDVNRNKLLQQLDQLDLIVTVEQFLTPTANCSDMVLPATTHFEELDVVPSYWHHWIGLNEPAIAPYFDARSDLEIARMLVRAINQKCPGSSNFPIEKSPAEILDGEFKAELYNMLGITHWSELANGPRRADIPLVAWADNHFPTASGKFEFFSMKALCNSKPALPEYKAGVSPCDRFPYWLITSHAQHSLNSQFQSPDWLRRNQAEPVIYIHPLTAAAKRIQSGGVVRVYNSQGSILLKAQTSPDTSPDTLVCYQGGQAANSCLNQLNPGLSSDMGEVSTGVKGMAFYDVFVNIEPA
jgi:anaerobic selenocysteine-containing dehydrogenase